MFYFDSLFFEKFQENHPVTNLDKVRAEGTVDERELKIRGKIKANVDVGDGS